ncbi:serine--tRNA ligase [Candidatus Bipolaricaulota bacterium]|nr:serine--tRNA ligase [Candidatus Bipolaricaulota bacterium]
MLDISRIRKHPDEVEKKLQYREEAITLDRILELDERRRDLIGTVEDLKHEKNEASQQIGTLKKQGQHERANEIIKNMGSLSERIEELEDELNEVERELQEEIDVLPNLPHDSVPVSDDEEDKVIIDEYGERPEFDFELKNHLELGEELDLFKFDKASKIAGARFPFYYGDGAAIEMALINFMFFYQVNENSYTPVFPPYLANKRSYYTSGQLPKFEDDLYHVEKDGLYLNPTSESILANYYRDEILSGNDLPKKFVSFTTCFRREAGSYGEEERGLIRTHQFNKVELFRFVRGEESYTHFEELITDAESILQELELHYRKVTLPTCDLAQQSSKTVDLEVWIPTQGEYYEVSSISNCEDFQSRRGNMRYRPETDAKPEFMHTLNGSGLATSRLLVAILENNQKKDGSIELPNRLAEQLNRKELK